MPIFLSTTVAMSLVMQPGLSRRMERGRPQVSRSHGHLLRMFGNSTTQILLEITALKWLSVRWMSMVGSPIRRSCLKRLRTSPFLLHSLDIGNAVDQTEPAYSWTISLVRTSDDATVFSHTTSLLDATPFVETVLIDYTGDPGEDYLLLFDDGGANTVRSAIDNLSFSEVAPSPLSLSVNRDTGEVFLGNSSGITVGIDSYEITSVSNSLDPVGWNSLEDQDFEGNGVPGTGNGWEEAGGIGTYQLIESYLQGGSTFTDGVSISLGSAFDVGAEEDLDFSYHVTGGPAILTSGEVDYVNGVVLLGDVNLDKVVNGLDVDPFVDVLLNGPYQDEADMNIDGEVNGLDVDPFVEAVVGGGLQAVPEPSTLALLVLALVGAGVLAYSRP